MQLARVVPEDGVIFLAGCEQFLGQHVKIGGVLIFYAVLKPVYGECGRIGGRGFE
jgi:hypothetical protein